MRPERPELVAEVLVDCRVVLADDLQGPLHRGVHRLPLPGKLSYNYLTMKRYRLFSGGWRDVCGIVCPVWLYLGSRVTCSMAVSGKQCCHSCFRDYRAIKVLRITENLQNHSIQNAFKTEPITEQEKSAMQKQEQNL